MLDDSAVVTDGPVHFDDLWDNADDLNVESIDEWLDGLGMAHLAPGFREEEVTISCLPFLTRQVRPFSCFFTRGPCRTS